LFLRAVRKLLLRFSPELADGDGKAKSAGSLLESVNDGLASLYLSDPKAAELTASLTPAKRKKIVEGIITDTRKLEYDCVAKQIPISHVRNASSWLYTAPNGRRKVLIIENADAMRIETRNALLKILEEPPENATSILTTPRPSVMLETILSRVRLYTFDARSEQAQSDVIRRVFHAQPAVVSAAGAATAVSLQTFLEGFLPVTPQSLQAAADYYTESVANGARNVKQVCDQTVALANKFEFKSTFGVFLSLVLECFNKNVLPKMETPARVLYAQKLRAEVNEAASEVDSYNMQLQAALEKLTERVRPS
jgi:DNA polymerase-3 subunit gamma/tau